MVDQKQAFRTARTRIINYPMVELPSSWPKADSGKCSIFEAIVQVGRAKYGPDWTNTELGASYWTEQPAEAEARRVAMSKLPVRKPPPPESLASYRASRMVVPVDKDHRSHVLARERHLANLAHQAAVEHEQQQWEANNLSFARLTSVVEWLAQQCRDGSLRTFYRFATGGALFDMAPSDWNVDRPLQMFVADGGYKRWFVNNGTSNQWPVLIFFDQSQLAKAIAAFSHAPDTVAVTALERLSPYLKLAVRLAVAKGYSSPDAADTQPVREAEVAAAWNAALPGVPPSRTAIEAIAKVMGFPNPTAILQGKSRRSGKRG